MKSSTSTKKLSLQSNFLEQVDTLILSLIKIYTSIYRNAHSVDLYLNLLQDYYAPSSLAQHPTHRKKHFYQSYKRNYSISPTHISTFISFLLEYLTNPPIEEVDTKRIHDLVSNLESQFSLFREQVQLALTLCPVLSCIQVARIFEQYSPPKYSFTIPILMDAMGYTLCTHPFEEFWLDAHAWWSTSLLDTYNVDDWIEKVIKTHKQDNTIYLYDVQKIILDQAEKEIPILVLESIMGLLRVESLEQPYLYRWHFDVIPLRYQIMRIFEKEHCPLTIRILMSYLNERLSESKKITNLNQVKSCLYNYPEFTALASSGYWILSHWEGYSKQTIIGQIIESLEAEPEPVNLDEFAKKLATPLSSITQELVHNRIVSRADLFIKLVDLASPEQDTVWTTLNKWETTFKDSGRYAPCPRTKKQRIKHLLNDALHSLIPKYSSLVISPTELSKSLAKLCNASDVTINHYLQYLKNCEIVGIGCRYKYSIPYRRDKKYFNIPERKTIKDRLEAIVESVLERGVWMKKNHLYAIVAEKMREKYNIHLSLPTFYLYLSRMSGIQHKKEGHTYSCMKEE